MSRLRIAASTSGCSSSSGCRRGWVTGVHGGSRSSGVAGDLDDVPQVVEVEQAVDLEHVVGVDLERARDLLAHRRAHAGADLDPHGLAEAPRAQLVLDGLQQVVGLVGDREVGVAGDAEDVRGRGSPCPGTARRGSRRSGPRAGRTCARRRPARSAAASPSAPSRARTSRTSVTGSRTITPSDSDRLEMYGNGRPSPTASGVSTGKIWRRKRSSRRLRSARGRRRRSRRSGCRARPARAAGRGSRQRDWRAMCSRTTRRIASSVSLGVRPSCSGFSIPASIWSCRPATRTMKNSSRLDEKIAQNFTRSSSGTAGSSASSSTRSLNCIHESSRLK